MSRQFFNTLVGMGSGSHDFDDELKISFLILSSDARSKTFILDLISGFLHLSFCTDSCLWSILLNYIINIMIFSVVVDW